MGTLNLNKEIACFVLAFAWASRSTWPVRAVRMQGIIKFRIQVILLRWSPVPSESHPHVARAVPLVKMK